MFYSFFPPFRIKLVFHNSNCTGKKLSHNKIQVAGKSQASLNKHPAFFIYPKYFILNRKKITPALISSIKNFRYSCCSRCHNSHADFIRYFCYLGKFRYVVLNNHRYNSDFITRNKQYQLLKK